MQVNFFHTNISPEAPAKVSEVLKSTFVSAGKLAEEFEKRLSVKLGLQNPVSLNSGTSALHLALCIADAGPGDEVILPPQTFIATGLVILMNGAKPVFADIQPDTGNIDPESVKQLITPKTKAIIPVHWGGYPCDLDEINAIAAEHDLAVIEDAAHAIGAAYKNRPIGSISRFTAFSFQAIKHLTTGDGGALCCTSPADHYEAKRRRWFDIDRDHSPVSLLGEREYDAVSIGFKYHLNDMAAALGLANLEMLDKTLEHHRLLASVYRDGLRNIPGIQHMNYKKDRQSSWWFFQMLAEKREDLIRYLKDKGFPASVVHLRIDRNSIFGGINHSLHGQEKFNNHQLSLPIHNGISPETAQAICHEIRKGW